MIRSFQNDIKDVSEILMNFRRQGLILTINFRTNLSYRFFFPFDKEDENSQFNIKITSQYVSPTSTRSGSVDVILFFHSTLFSLQKYKIYFLNTFLNLNSTDLYS